jgi:glycerol kinase
MLPEVKSSGEIYGYARLGGEEIPVCGVAGDQQAALFGQCCYEKGEAKNTYGTGCFLLMNAGEEMPESKHGLITTLTARLKGERPQYALEGSVFVGGAVIQWLRDEMKFFAESKDVEKLAQEVPDTGGVYFVPAFTGLGAPYWDMYARGGIFGLTRGTKRAHVIRAAEESIAYQSAELVFAMEKDVGEAITVLKVDGGASRDAFLMGFQADILGAEVVRPKSVETTALGAAALAGLTCGVWQDKAEIKALYTLSQRYVPKMTQQEREEKIKNWRKCVGLTRGFAAPKK